MLIFFPVDITRIIVQRQDESVHMHLNFTSGKHLTGTMSSLLLHARLKKQKQKQKSSQRSYERNSKHMLNNSTM